MQASFSKKAALFIFAASAQFCLSPAFADTYDVTFQVGRQDDDGAMRRADVVATLTPEDGAISMIRSGEDTGVYHQWANFLTKIDVQDGSGEPLDIVYEPHGVWRLPKWRKGEVTARYTMLLQHDRFPNEPGDDELAHATPYGVMWTGRALLMEGKASDDITISFSGPDDWRVTTPWQRLDEAGLSFRAKDTDDLLDSAFFAGTHVETITNVNGIEARMASGPDMGLERALYQQTLQTYLTAYSSLFGVPVSDVPVVIGVRGSFWGGGVMGRSISLTHGGEMNPQVAPMVMYIVAHEIFHLWNATWRNSDDSRPPIEWIWEGTAEYYTYLTGVRVGDFPPDVLFDQIGSRWETYLNALDANSIADAGYTKLKDQKSYDLVYSGGMMMSLALDMLIRRETENEKSLDDALKLIHARFGDGAGTDLTKASLVKAIRDATGVNTGRFFKRYLAQSDPLPMAELLKYAGVCLTSQMSEGAPAATVARCDENTPANIAVWNSWVAP